MRLKHYQTMRLQNGLVFVVIGALVGCGWLKPAPTPTATLEPSMMDRSLLTDEPCAAPCWYGLELGQSAKADALKIAKTLSFIDPTVFPEKPDGYWDRAKQELVPATFLRLMCRQPGGQSCAGLLFVNDNLKRVFLFPNYYLSLADIVAHLGPPDYVSILPTPGHQPLCDIALIWSQRHISVGVLNEAGQVRCNKVHGGKGIDPDLPVEQIVYMLSDDSALTTIPEDGRDFPWTGFTEP